MKLFELTTFALVLGVVLAGCAFDQEREPDPDFTSTEQALFKCGNYDTYWFEWNCDGVVAPLPNPPIQTR